MEEQNPFLQLVGEHPSNLPYGSAQALMDDLLRLAGMLCLVLAELQEQTGQPYDLRGTAAPPDSLHAALFARSAPPLPLTAIPEAAQAAAHIRARVRCTVQTDLPFVRVARRFLLTDFEAFCLLLALCPDLDCRFAHSFAALQGDPKRTRATLGLARDLFLLVHRLDESEVYAMLDRQQPVNALLLVDWPEDAGQSVLARPLAVCRQVLYELTGVAGAGIDGLPLQTTLLHPDAQPILWNRARIDAGADFLRYALAHPCAGQLRVLCLFGADGCGKTFALTQMAQQAGLAVRAVDAAALLRGPMDALLRQVAVRCLLDDCIPCIDRLAVDSPEARALVVQAVRFLQDNFPLLLLCADQPWDFPQGLAADCLMLECPLPSVRDRRALWQHFAEQAGTPLAGDELDALAGRYRLRPSEIRALAGTVARVRAVQSDAPSTPALVAVSLREQARSRLGGLAHYLPSPFTWDDLKVPDDAARMLRSACTRIQYLYQVNESWGFARRLPYGQGVSVLLYGPPGTGKSMAAQVLAREVGIDLFRVDLSQIVDKYIGETEKNLGRLFDTADGVNCILFFDEADALFSKRTEVGDAKDKYANVETAYLLQRIEQFPGITILATNNARNFDEAFRRRMTYYINIPMPDRDTRERIWRSVFPPELPIDRGVSFAELADRFEFAGSNIKSVAVSAAYAAAAAGTPVTRQSIQQALQIEYLKTGKLLALGEYPC